MGKPTGFIDYARVPAPQAAHLRARPGLAGVPPRLGQHPGARAGRPVHELRRPHVPLLHRMPPRKRHSRLERLRLPRPVGQGPRLTPLDQQLPPSSPGASVPPPARPPASSDAHATTTTATPKPTTPSPSSTSKSPSPITAGRTAGSPLSRPRSAPARP